MLLHERIEKENIRLLLASKSPRRRELMAGALLPFVTAADFEVEELYPAGLPAEEVAPYLSLLKSEGYPHVLEPRDVLITADTVVIAGGRILGKPACEAEARDMLAGLSGRRHTVVTGVTLRSAAGLRTFAVSSDVLFAPLSDEIIEYYVRRFSPMDKAGSYGIQEWIGYVGIESIEGSFYNVMGLPVQRLCRELETFVESM